MNLLGLSPGMWWLLIGWAVAYGCLIGWGALACRLCGPRTTKVMQQPDASTCFWTGMGLLAAFLLWWSLFAPVNRWCVAIVLVVAACGLISYGLAARSRECRLTIRRTASVLLQLLLLALLSAVAVAGVARNLQAYDTLLYHDQAVRWASEYPAVPGLANLHIRLGTNSVWHLFAALVNQGPMAGQSAWLLPGFIQVVFIVYLLRVIFFAADVRFTTKALALGLLPYALREWALTRPGLYFDIPAQYALMAAVVEWSRIRDRGREGREHIFIDLFVPLVCAALSFVIKPVAAPALLILLMVYGWHFFGKQSRAAHWIVKGRMLILLSLILAGWMMRNAILSGWLVFPAPVGPLPVDWRVPLNTSSALHADQMQTVAGQKAIIQAWARRPGPEHQQAMHVPLKKWLPSWYEQNKAALEIKWVWPAGCVLALLVMAMRCGRLARAEIVLLVIVMAQLVFWLFQAPDLRYGRGLFWIWLAVPLSMVLGWLYDHVSRRGVVFLTAGLVVLMTWGSIPLALETIHTSRWMLGRAFALLVVKKAINDQSPPLEVYVPVRSDQTGDAPLPATPHPSAGLKARAPGDLRQGFLRSVP